MDKSTSELTVSYVKEHPYIKSCLKKGLINYSALSRLIAKDLGIEKKTSKEAILVAARRFKDKLKDEKNYEQKIRLLLRDSEIEIKNRIDVFIMEKSPNFDLSELEHKARKENSTFFLLGGSDNYTVVVQGKYSSVVKSKYKNIIIRHNQDLALINIKSPKEIEEVVGVVSYLCSLFSENGVNIVEFLSCWRDTLFIINSKDVTKAISFLNFSIENQ